MARIRTIKPSFWSHEELSELPEATHMLAGALLNYADDQGYFNANIGLVRAACSPLREPSVSIPESLRSLQMMGYLRIGMAPDGKRYGHIVHFEEHQKVSHATPSKIATLSITWETPGEIPESLQKVPESLRPELKGIEGNKEEEGNGDLATFVAALPDDCDLAVQLWNEMADRVWQKRQVHKLTAGRRAALKRRLRDCGGMDGWIAALAKVEASPMLTDGFTGRDGRHWPGADFDFLLQEKSFTKLMEGGYDRSDKTDDRTIRIPRGSYAEYLDELKAEARNDRRGVGDASCHEDFAGAGEASGPVIDGDVECVPGE